MNDDEEPEIYSGWELNALGICGCGTSDGMKGALLALLESMVNDDGGAGDRRDAYFKALDAFGPEDSLGRELALHHLDAMNLTEHGGTIRYSWCFTFNKTVAALLARKGFEE